MARYTDAVCKLCRREGVKLFFKRRQDAIQISAIEKSPERAYAPRTTWQKRSKQSEYGIAAS